MRPKILGAHYLHEHTKTLSLDFFACFSAGAALLGSPGQINYSAANAFMDGLAQMRRRDGFPAISLNWGAWDEVGMAAGVNEQTKAQWRATGIELITPETGLALFFDLLVHNPAQVGVLPMNWAKVVQQSGRLGERPFFQQILSAYTTPQSTSATPNDNILARLDQAPAGERLEMLESYVQEQVRRVLGLNEAQMPDSRQGLTDIGMDSLMAVELSNRLQAGVEQPLPSTLAFEQPTIEALTIYLANEVLGLQTIEAVSDAIETDDKAHMLLAEIEELSDSEAEDSLLKELEEAGY
jgi:hypothetical protein